MTNGFTRSILLTLFLLAGASVDAETADADSTQTARPSFAMVPT